MICIMSVTVCMFVPIHFIASFAILDMMLFHLQNGDEEPSELGCLSTTDQCSIPAVTEIGANSKIPHFNLTTI